jgi:UDP-2-acetamido-2-deoxy-ribo-hexuluronate aminotransferase
MEFVDLKSQYRALKADIDARIQRVLDHGQYIMGPEVQELEEALAAYTGARHCITCASGTEALLMSLMALGIGRDDEVITTPFTFAATAEMIVLLGARPVFVDIEPDTCLMDASKAEAAITERTRAIMPVSLYGQVCDMDAINAIAARHGGLPVIEDAAQSFGASYSGRSGQARKSCHLSTLGCTSFFPSKPLGCYGDGGAIFTDDNALATALREIRVHGQQGRYVHTRVGVGGRMDTLQCAVVLAKLQRFDRELGCRRAHAAEYTRQLESSNCTVQLPVVRPDRDSAWAQYTVLVDHREVVQGRLKERGIPTAVHYPLPLDEQPAYRHLSQGDGLPNSRIAARRVLCLPMSADLTDSDASRVVAALVAATRH